MAARYDVTVIARKNAPFVGKYSQNRDYLGFSIENSAAIQNFVTKKKIILQWRGILPVGITPIVAK